MRWDSPQPVDAITMAFPADIGHLMPAIGDIPLCFHAEETTWSDFQAAWFAFGLPEETVFHAKPGIDVDIAVGHLWCLQASYAYPHQHKAAAVAYLASLWFDRVVVSETEVYGELTDEHVTNRQEP